MNRVSSVITTSPLSTVTIPVENESTCHFIEENTIDKLWKKSNTTLNQLDRNSGKAECFETVENIEKEDFKINENVEFDLSQSVDNIDRILQNIDEKLEETTIIDRDVSFESQSLVDYQDSSMSSETIQEVVQISSENAEKLIPINSTQMIKDWMMSTEGSLSLCARLPSLSSTRYTNFNTRKLIKNNLKKNCGTCRSTSCIQSYRKDVDSPVESMLSPPLMLNTYLPKNKLDSAGSETSSMIEETIIDPNEKKKKLKSALIKRARSVAAFSLKLKEKRVKSECKEIDKSLQDKISPKNENVMVGGELSCVPIEMLISIDDINLRRQQSKKSVDQNVKTGT